MIGAESPELCEGLKQLKDEHPPLLNKLDEILKRCKSIERAFEQEQFSHLINDVLLFKDELEPHSEREEGVLFKMMEAYIGKEMGPLAVMEYEHDQAKGCIGKFIENTKQDRPFSKEEMMENVELIKNAYFILVDHFAKEEKVLFPMAENLLSLEEKVELLQQIRN
jgi:hemerythrin-like domain-containing protein